MKCVVISRDVIINAPTILAGHPQHLKLLVPSLILTEMQRWDRKFPHSTLGSLLENAIHSKVVEKVPTPLVFSVSKDSLPMAAIAAVNAAKAYASQYPGEEVALATDDENVRAFALAADVQVISSNELLSAIAGQSVPDAQLLLQANAVISGQRWYVGGSVLFAFGLTALFYMGLLHFEEIIAALSIAGTIAAISICGVLLFAIRARLRLYYGAFEYLFGWFSVGFGVYHFTAQGDGVIKLVGGLYVMVRGLENIGKGLKDTKYSVPWKKYFPD